MGVLEELVRAREAYERRDWLAAYGALSEADPSTLDADDFARLATAAYLLGRQNDCVLAMQRAYQVNVEAGDVLAAVRCAFWLAMSLSQAGEPAVAGGWRSRAERLLGGVDGDVVERGYVRCHVLFTCIHGGRFDEARAVAAEVAHYGQRFDDQNLVAMGLCTQGRLAMMAGDVPGGLRLLDEAMVAVTTGELAPVFAGEIYCTMIEGCQEVSDYGRVEEWTNALASWCAAQPDLVMFTGQCAVHRAQIMRVRGAYTAALDELDHAVTRYLLAGTPAPAGLALTERGDVLRITGDLPGSADAYAEARQHGYEPQPGEALLWLAQGRSEPAAAVVRRLLLETHDPVGRSRLLPAAIEVLLAADDVDQAAVLADELDVLAESFGCAALLARSGQASGAVLVRRGEAAAALPRLRGACRVWSDLGAMYDLARCRLLVGQACGDLGDQRTQDIELAAARAAFEELGATIAAREVDRLLPTALPGGLTGREVEVLRLVAAGRSNPEIAAMLVLSEKTVARHLSNIFGKLGVTSRTAAAAYAYEHQLV